jgi:hypothetical protein
MIAAPVFTIKGTYSRACVMADDVRISSWSGKPRAEERLTEIVTSGKYKNRKCMAHCPTVFLSEGPHHRLCSVCRRKTASADTVAV